MVLSEPEGRLGRQDRGARGVLLGDAALCDQMENVGGENLSRKGEVL